MDGEEGCFVVIDSKAGGCLEELEDLFGGSYSSKLA
jgi:hypothetical protein